MEYDRRGPIDKLRALPLAPDSMFEIGRAYAEMGTYGRIIRSRQEIDRERERLEALMMGAIVQERQLEEAMRVLEEEDALRETARENLYNKLIKNEHTQNGLLSRAPRAREGYKAGSCGYK